MFDVSPLDPLVQPLEEHITEDALEVIMSGVAFLELVEKRYRHRMAQY